MQSVQHFFWKTPGEEEIAKSIGDVKYR